MHCKSGCCRAATVLLLCGLTSGLLANASATAEAVREQMSGHIIDLDPADLAAVSGPTRRLMATLTDHIKLISTEMGALRAGKAALAERVTRLEELDCSRREEEIEAKDETKMPQKPKPVEPPLRRGSTGSVSAIVRCGLWAKCWQQVCDLWSTGGVSNAQEGLWYQQSQSTCAAGPAAWLELPPGTPAAGTPSCRAHAAPRARMLGQQCDGQSPHAPPRHLSPPL